MTIVLPYTVVGAMMRHVKEHVGYEVCGIVVDGEYHPIKNVSQFPETSYVMEPKGMMDLVNSRGGNDSGFMYFHSHPNTEAQPSDQDVQWSRFMPDGTTFLIYGGSHLNGFVTRGGVWEEVGVTCQ